MMSGYTKRLQKAMLGLGSASYTVYSDGFLTWEVHKKDGTISELLHFDADRAVVRVRLATLQGRTVEALGACDRDELPPEDRRSVHDVISRAETRAFKRALELAIGLPFINELIAQLFPQPQTNQARPQPQASTQAQKKVTDGPTAFWSKARARGLSREKAMEIIRQHTTQDGQTDWARAIEELETLK